MSGKNQGKTVFAEPKSAKMRNVIFHFFDLIFNVLKICVSPRRGARNEKRDFWAVFGGTFLFASRRGAVLEKEET